VFNNLVNTPNQYGQQVGREVPNWSLRQMPQRVELLGRTVTAQPISSLHTQDLFDSVCGPGDGALWTYRPASQPRNIAEFADRVVRPLGERTDSVSFAFIPAGGSAAGLATFSRCAPESGVVEISGVLWGRSMQRSTAATEAIYLMLGYAFDQLGYRRVEWKCDSLNEPSRSAAERLGFSYDGRFRQHMVVKDRTRNTDWFSMIDAEWPTIHARAQRWLAPENFDVQGRQLKRLGDI
jgi:RimJ/RimL family protein N-acetyltransferase